MNTDYKTIKALSIRQPWAHLIVQGWYDVFKDIENRDWKYAPRYRGPLLIHASKTFDREGVEAANSILQDNFEESHEIEEYLPTNGKVYTRGGFVGMCRLNDVVDHDDSPWFFGPMGFKLRMPQTIKFIPYRGQLGLFDVPQYVIQKIQP